MTVFPRGEAANSHQRELTPIATAHAGNLALVPAFSEEGHSERQLKFAASRYVTNLPSEILPYEATNLESSFYYVGLSPRELDALPIGTYHLTDLQLSINYEDEVNDSDTRALTISEGPKGKVFDRDALGLSKDRQDSGLDGFIEVGTQLVLADLGFVIDEYGDDWSVEALPTPLTLQAAAKELGVTVELFPDYGVIPAEPHLMSHAAGNHPVATKAQDEYIHDTEDNHMTIRVLGGQYLTDVLADVSQNALDEFGSDSGHHSEVEIVGASMAVDVFSDSLHDFLVAYEGSERSNESFASMKKSAIWLGISHKTLVGLLQATIVNAQHYGIAVSPAAAKYAGVKTPAELEV